LLAQLLLERGSEPREVLAVGVEVPGPVEQTPGLLKSPPTMPGWDGFPIRSAFADEYAALSSWTTTT
jgi:predicted NBD/HSP70 family sugar kinase